MAQRKLEAKQVVHHAQIQKTHLEGLSPCFSFTVSTGHLLEADAFYLIPLRKPKGISVGCNTLCNTVQRLCKAGRIDGFKTNHSLRVTTATRLLERGAVDYG